MSTHRSSAAVLTEARIIVIKIGSALLADHEHSELREDWLHGLAIDIAALRERNQRVIVVSSGAIALGRGILRYDLGQLTLERSQAAAAAGQIRLAQAYSAALAPYGVVAAQVLLTLGDTQDRRRYLNARATLGALLAAGAVPIINENDTVATDEIRYGDNDRLAARTALMVGADLLVMLSDVDGLYTADPRTDRQAQRIAEVTEVTNDMIAAAGETGSALARGGMRTKLLAAQSAIQGGCWALIARGGVLRPLSDLEHGAPCTLFRPSDSPQAARKRWIAGMQPSGALLIDAGAAKALRSGRSLLPVGLRGVDGEFSRGDAVGIRTESETELVATGLVAYNADDARRIAGMSSDAIRASLGHPAREELVHRDDMVIWGQA